MNLFYAAENSGKAITLSPDESRHCIKVLRLRKGDRIHLLNGKGYLLVAEIAVADPKNCLVQVIEENFKEDNRSYRLTIAIAPTKNIDRFEWFAEKATEIGIHRIIPLICKHSERKEINPERIEKIIISAMKQSGQLYLPELVPATTFRDLVTQHFEGDKMIAHCEDGEKRLLKSSLIPGHELLILIGPEGDFDPAEIKQALDSGFIPVSLGDSRLRTETAGLVACHSVSLINQ